MPPICTEDAQKRIAKPIHSFQLIKRLPPYSLQTNENLYSVAAPSGYQTKSSNRSVRSTHPQGAQRTGKKKLPYMLLTRFTSALHASSSSAPAKASNFLFNPPLAKRRTLSHSILLFLFPGMSLRLGTYCGIPILYPHTSQRSCRSQT